VQDGGGWCNRGRMSAHADKLDASANPADPASVNLPKPYLKADGTLVIPMLSDPKYHWWKKGGQAVGKTVQELKAGQGNGG